MPFKMVYSYHMTCIFLLQFFGPFYGAVLVTSVKGSPLTSLSVRLTSAEGKAVGFCALHYDTPTY